METLHFSTTIKAPAEKIWSVLWSDKTYRAWTGIFDEGAYAVPDWKEGSKILFLSAKAMECLAQSTSKF
ncbi:MAG: hypothetical protein ABIQ31_09120 [Ferruginibacter sp.]